MEQAGFSLVNILVAIEEVVAAGGAATRAWFEACGRAAPHLTGALLAFLVHWSLSHLRWQARRREAGDVARALQEGRRQAAMAAARAKEPSTLRQPPPPPLRA